MKNEKLYQLLEGKHKWYHYLNIILYASKKNQENWLGKLNNELEISQQ